MSSKPEEFLIQAWKRQLDGGLRVLEALAEGAIRTREVQLEAAAKVHADTVATLKAVAAASTAAELIRLQAQWTRSNAEACLAYWRALQQEARQTNAELAKCLSGQSTLAAPESLGDLEASKQALLGALDNGFKQWLAATQQFYKLPAAPWTH